MPRSVLWVCSEAVWHSGCCRELRSQEAWVLIFLLGNRTALGESQSSVLPVSRMVMTAWSASCSCCEVSPISRIQYIKGTSCVLVGLESEAMVNLAEALAVEEGGLLSSWLEKNRR